MSPSSFHASALLDILCNPNLTGKDKKNFKKKARACILLYQGLQLNSLQLPLPGTDFFGAVVFHVLSGTILQIKYSL